MKNIQPDMDLERQVRKGCATVNLALDETPPNIQKACLAAHFTAQMIEWALVGYPQPWSQFKPMIDEEYDHN